MDRPDGSRRVRNPLPLGVPKYDSRDEKVVRWQLFNNRAGLCSNPTYRPNARQKRKDEFVKEDMLIHPERACCFEELLIRRISMSNSSTPLPGIFSCTGYVRRVTHDEIADAVCTVYRHHHL